MHLPGYANPQAGMSQMLWQKSVSAGLVFWPAAGVWDLILGVGWLRSHPIKYCIIRSRTISFSTKEFAAVLQQYCNSTEEISTVP
jgi:hypothetical protein